MRTTDRLKTALAGLIVGLVLALPVFALEKYGNETAAQQHCPSDTVVWLNIPTMIWHYKGQRWYGQTKDGAYVCMKEAAAEGARSTHNHQ
jgi:hypothetical protein